MELAAVPAFDIVEIRQLPLYNQDDDEGGHPPAAYTAITNVREPTRCCSSHPQYVAPAPGRARSTWLRGPMVSAWEGKPGDR
jgi:hypothetical protein